MSIKDVADLFAAEGEGARQIIGKLKEDALDALGVAISEAPPKGDTLGRYRYFKEALLPLLMSLRDPGERRAALEDIAGELKLKTSNLNKALTAEEKKRAEKKKAEKVAAEGSESEDSAGEVLTPEPGSERHERAMELLRSPDLLFEAAQAMERLGHVGELNNKQLAFVCAVSARAGTPIQPSTHAQSSSGKNFLWDSVLSLLPPEMVIKRSGLSAKALFRTEVDLRGAILYLQEVAGSEGAEFAIRVMQSDGRLVYEATEKTPDGDMRNVVHEKEGPLTIVQTTTSLHIHHENETRVLPIYIDESEEQTKRIVESVLMRAKGEGDDDPEERKRLLAVWHDAIRLLEPGKEVIRYADRLEVPTSTVRVRRDVGKILDLVRIVAWLRQHHRERDERERIVAVEEDFHKSLSLVGYSLSRAWKALAPLEEAVLKAIRKLPEARQQNGFKRSDPKLEDASGRRIQEALKSLTSTGYLDSDGRRGPQGSTYTLPRKLEEAALGISLRPPDEEEDASDEADTDEEEDNFTFSSAPGDLLDGDDEKGNEETKRGSRGIAREGNRAIENPDLQVKDVNARSRGEDGEGDSREEEAQDNEEAEGEGMDEEEAEEEENLNHLKKLTEHGWFRSRDIANGDGGGETSMDGRTVDEDPLARWICSQVYLYDPGPGSYPWAATAEELFEAGDEEGSRPTGWPSDPRETHERLVRMAPALQTKGLYGDVRAEMGYPSSNRRFKPEELRREGYLRLEHWRKEGAAEEEGIWAFVGLKPGWRVPEEDIESSVWWKVADLEGLTEDDEDEGYEWG